MAINIFGIDEREGVDSVKVKELIPDMRCPRCEGEIRRVVFQSEYRPCRVGCVACGIFGAHSLTPTFAINSFRFEYIEKAKEFVGTGHIIKLSKGKIKPTTLKKRLAEGCYSGAFKEDGRWAVPLSVAEEIAKNFVL
jgi:hypothetical protein